MRPERLEMSAVLSRLETAPVHDARRPRPDDLDALAALMFSSYRGTVDYTGESIEDARREIEKTFAGAHGIFLPQHSYVVERGPSLASASLITRPGRWPLLAFAMTAPSWKRTGLARATIKNVMNDLFEAGDTRLDLVVNPQNEAAVALYVDLGFVATVDR